MKFDKERYEFLRFEKEKDETFILFFDKEKKENGKFKIKNIYEVYDDKKNWIFSIVKDEEIKEEIPLTPPKLIRTKKTNIKKVIKKSIAKKRKKRN